MTGILQIKIQYIDLTVLNNFTEKQVYDSGAQGQEFHKIIPKKSHLGEANKLILHLSKSSVHQNMWNKNITDMQACWVMELIYNTILDEVFL